MPEPLLLHSQAQIYFNTQGVLALIGQPVLPRTFARIVKAL
jgi:hypothetical protein